MTPAAELVWLDPCVWRTICSKARGLVGSYGFTSGDCDDLQQEAALDLHLRLRYYDPARSGRRTFVQRVVGNRFANLIAERRAGCRDYRACLRSLDEPAGQDGVRCFGETLSEDEYESRMGRRSLPWVRNAELHADVERVMALLPPDLAAVAGLLMSMSAGEAAQRLNLSRATAYRRIGRIREVFHAAGLEGYLGQFEPTCSSPGFDLLDSTRGAREAVAS
jgi:DNA-directed RNA polymerase specialized sigma24 family protein